MFWWRNLSLQAWVNQRLVPSHLHSLKKLKTSTLYLILIKWFLSLSCFVKHLPLKLFMHKKVIIQIHFTGTQLFTWERVPSAWPELGDSSQGSASSPGSQEASLEQKQESVGIVASKDEKLRVFPLHQNPTTEVMYAKWTSQSKMIRDTNQRAARGAVLHTGRRVEEAGHSEGSYQASASNLGPKEHRRNFNRNFGFKYLPFWNSSKLTTFEGYDQFVSAEWQTWTWLSWYCMNMNYCELIIKRKQEPT